jgi:hypothetical protein
MQGGGIEIAVAKPELFGQKTFELLKNRYVKYSPRIKIPEGTLAS